LQISDRTVRRLINDGELTGYPMGRHRSSWGGECCTAAAISMNGCETQKRRELVRAESMLSARGIRRLTQSLGWFHLSATPER
jgi:hypothetical protein